MDGNWRILVADDEPAMRESLAAWLREDGYTVATAASGRQALEMTAAEPYDIHFIDLKMPPGPGGLEVLAGVRRMQPDATVVIITAYATVDTAVAAIRDGAADYMVKPCNPEDVSRFVERTLHVKRLERENENLRRRLGRLYSLGDIVSKNPRMHAIFDLVRDVAGQRSTVLIEGASGTGKELVARALHREGGRSGLPFVGVSCAALAETLLESELFGHERGAFTGAMARRAGKFELAGAGTIFLDEIGDIPPKLQLDLLRVLQERSFTRLGGTTELPMEARIVAATNRDLRGAVAAGAFREDLFYRLNVINIRLPSLAERCEDIPLLAAHFARRLAVETGRPVTGVARDALKLLMAHDWPGNVRELENAVERAVVTSRGGELAAADFDFLAASPRAAGWDVPAGVPLSELERRAVEAALRRTGGNISDAAGMLGVDRSTVYAKIRKYGIPH
ncbi:MAG TPA: sigma-54 dependent transcriptional regulator [Candidatus Krumholzibacteria bacterium]|nr:sigma-54 dependent transcriptional regulator [Candidatus Krumholzibacteria bacterium]